MSWPLSQDYNEAIQDPRNSFSDSELKTGEATANALGIPMPRSGNFADVYEMRCPSGSRWAVKCFTREVFGLRERYAEIGKYLRLAKLPFMVDFQYLEQGIRVRGQWYPILKMQWVEGFLLNEFVRDNLDKKAILQGLGQIWVKMARRLRESYIAHCDLQHGNVLFVPGSTASSLAVKLIDYDGMCVPSLVGTKSGEVGHPAYQHPERLRTGAYDQEVDRFSLLSIAAALRCLAVGGRSLWERYDTGDNLLFRQADFQTPKESPLFQELLAIRDPQAQILVKELQSACQKPLDAAPLLTDLLPEEKPAGKVTKTVSASSPAVAQQVAGARGPDWDFSAEEPGASVVKKRQASRGMPMWAWGAMAGGAAVVLLGVGLGVGLFLRKGSDEQGATPVALHKPDKKPVKAPPKQPQDDIEPNPAPNENPGIPRNDNNNPPAVQPAPEHSIARRIFQLAPAGDMLALSDEGANTWRLVNPRTNEVIHELKGHQDAISAVAFSADGSRAITGGHDKQMIVWDVKTARSLRQVRYARAPLVSVALSPDGKKAVGADNTKTVVVWDVESGSPHSFGHSHNVLSVAFSSDGENFLCGQEQSDKPEDVVMMSWHLPPKVSSRSFRGSSVAVTGIAASADGNYIATAHWGQTPMVSLWEARTHRLLWRASRRPGFIHQLAFSPDSRFLVAAAGAGYQVWHVGPTIKFAQGGGNGGQELLTTRFTPDSRAISLVFCKGERTTQLQPVRLPSSAESGEALTPVQAAAKAGQKVTVQLRVQGGGTNGEFAELYSEPAWDREGNMVIRFPESTRKKYQENGIPDVGRHLSQKLIRVSGTVTMLRLGGGSYPCIVIDDPGQIKEVSGTVVAGNSPPAGGQAVAWETTDPDRDCKFTENEGKLTITVPAKSHVLDLSANGMNSPRVLREVEGDFTAQVRVRGDFIPAAASTNGARFSWIGAGLLLWVNDNTFLRLEVAAWHERKPSTLYAGWEVRQDGKYIDVKHNYPSLYSGEQYLRLERRGKQILASYSPNGQSWSNVKPLDIELPAKVKIGVLAGSTTSRTFAPAFDQFQLKQGQGDMVRIDNWLKPAAEGAVIVKPPQRPRRRRFSNRMAVPDAATRNDKKKEILVLYQDDYKNMSKRELSTRLYDQSMRQGDGGLRYVMLSEARELAAQSGDFTAALRAVTRLCQQFDADSLEQKCRAVEEASAAVTSKIDNRALTLKVLLLIDRARIDERYELADRLLKVARAAAEKADMSTVLKKAVDHSAKQLEALRTEYEAVKPAAVKLDSDPQDEQASLALGKFRCFICENWDAGLPLLERGSDPTLRELARKDLAAPENAADRAKLGDAWYEQAGKATGKEKTAYLKRAFYWYQDAVDDLDRKEQSRVKQQLVKLKPQLPELSRPFADLDFVGLKVNRKLGLLHVGPHQMVATRRLFRGPIDIRVTAVLPKSHIRISFLNGGEMVVAPEGNGLQVRVYHPFGSDPEERGNLINTSFGRPVPGPLQEVRIQVRKDGWRSSINGQGGGGQSGGNMGAIDYIPSPVRVWSDDGEIDIKSIVVKPLR